MFSKTLTALVAVAAAAGLGAVHTGEAQAASIPTPPLSVQAQNNEALGLAVVDVELPAPWRFGPGECSSPDATLTPYFRIRPGHWQYTIPQMGGYGLQVNCPIQRSVRTSHLVKHTGRVVKPGARWTSRTSGAYSTGGNCNWSAGSYGQMTTCLFAHASLTYTLTVPKGRTFSAVTHHVSSGIADCRNPSWSVRHKRGTRTWQLGFFHGSRSGFSQCVVENVGLAYRWTSRVYSTSTLHRTATRTVVVAYAP